METLLEQLIKVDPLTHWTQWVPELFPSLEKVDSNLLSLLNQYKPIIRFQKTSSAQWKEFLYQVWLYSNGDVQENLVRSLKILLRPYFLHEYQTVQELLPRSLSWLTDPVPAETVTVLRQNSLVESLLILQSEDYRLKPEPIVFESKGYTVLETDSNTYRVIFSQTEPDIPSDRLHMVFKDNRPVKGELEIKSYFTPAPSHTFNDFLMDLIRLTEKRCEHQDDYDTCASCNECKGEETD